MRTLLLPELLKLKKKTTIIYLPLAMAIVSLVIAFTSCISLFFRFKGETHQRAVATLETKTFLSSGVTLLIFFVGISLFVLAASSIASEYSLGTLKNCFIFQPNRMKFLLGKLCAVILYGSALFALCCLITIFASAVFGLVGGVRAGVIFSLSSLLITASVCCTSYLAVISYVILGVSAGTILKSPAMAISLPLIWMVVIEPLFGGAVKFISPYLFGNAVAKMATPHNLGGFSGNLLIVLIYLIPLSVNSYRVTMVRDI